jgi:hypothetical protein
LDRVGRCGCEDADDDDMLRVAKYEYGDDVGAVRVGVGVGKRGVIGFTRGMRNLAG